MLGRALLSVACLASPEYWVHPGVPHLAWEQAAWQGHQDAEPLLWQIGCRLQGDVEYQWHPTLCAPDYDNGEVIEVCYGDHPVVPALRFCNMPPGYIVEITALTVWVEPPDWTPIYSATAPELALCWPEFWEWSTP